MSKNITIPNISTCKIINVIILLSRIAKLSSFNSITKLKLNILRKAPKNNTFCKIFSLISLSLSLIYTILFPIDKVRNQPLFLVGKNLLKNILNIRIVQP